LKLTEALVNFKATDIRRRVPVTADQIPPTAVVRVSRGNFDSARFPEVREMTVATGRYLIPAIKKLTGLISYYAGASPDGSMVPQSSRCNRSDDSLAAAGLVAVRGGSAYRAQSAA
jgi:hypothetical protein